MAPQRCGHAGRVPLWPGFRANEHAGARQQTAPRGGGAVHLLVLFHQGALASFLGVQVVHVQVAIRGPNQQPGDLLNPRENEQRPRSRTTALAALVKPAASPPARPGEGPPAPTGTATYRVLDALRTRWVKTMPTAPPEAATSRPRCFT